MSLGGYACKGDKSHLYDTSKTPHSHGSLYFIVIGNPTRLPSQQPTLKSLQKHKKEGHSYDGNSKQLRGVTKIATMETQNSYDG